MGRREHRNQRGGPKCPDHTDVEARGRMERTAETHTPKRLTLGEGEGQMGDLLYGFSIVLEICEWALLWCETLNPYIAGIF